MSTDEFVFRVERGAKTGEPVVRLYKNGEQIAFFWGKDFQQAFACLEEALPQATDLVETWQQERAEAGRKSRRDEAA